MVLSSENRPVRMRARSNSAESWVAAIRGAVDGSEPVESSRRAESKLAGISTLSFQRWNPLRTRFYMGYHLVLLVFIIFLFLLREEAEPEATQRQQERQKSPSPNPPLSPLIPEPVANILIPPTVSITPAPNKAPVRPSNLDLGAPKRPQRHLRPPGERADGEAISPGLIFWLLDEIIGGMHLFMGGGTYLFTWGVEAFIYVRRGMRLLMGLPTI